MIDFEPLYIPLIIVGVGSTISYVFLKLWYGYRKDQLRAEHKPNKSKEAQDLETQLNDLIDNAPRLKAELDRQIEDQRSKGVSNEQMSGLMMYKQIVDLAASNPQLAQIIGKPLVKGIVGFATKIPKIINSLVSI